MALLLLRQVAPSLGRPTPCRGPDTGLGCHAQSLEWSQSPPTRRAQTRYAWDLTKKGL
jgi:hypothetical protein